MRWGKKPVLLVSLVVLGAIEIMFEGCKGLGIDKHMLSIIISQAGTTIWLLNYSRLSAEYYDERSKLC